MPVLSSVAVSLWLAIAAAFIAVSGTAFVAENAEPGDVLYSMKTNVNERVLGSLVFSPAAEARLKSILALRRAGESGELAADGRLSADVRSHLQEEFEAHSKAVLEYAQEAAEGGNAEVAADIMAIFATELSTSEIALRGMSNLDESARAQLQIMSALVAATHRDAVRASETLVARAVVDAKAEGEADAGTDERDDNDDDGDTNDDSDNDDEDEEENTSPNDDAEVDGSVDVNAEGGVRIAY